MRAPQPGHVRLTIVAIVAAALAFPLGVVASHTFSDVPTSSTFHADISAIAAKGVTTGCAAGSYCPKDFVTREQMAAFLNRLGALQAGKTPVVNADKVDGWDAAGLTRFAFGEGGNEAEILSSDFLVFGTVEITVPSAGFVLVNASVTLRNVGCTSFCEVFAHVKHVDSLQTGEVQGTSAVFLYDQMSTTSVFAVSAGTNTFALRLLRDFEGNGTISAWNSELTAQFSPFLDE